MGKMSEELNSLKQTVDTNAADIEELNSMQVVEDHFFTNEGVNLTNKGDRYCTESIPIAAHQTFDFTATATSRATYYAGDGHIALKLWRDNDRVAYSAIHEARDPDGNTTNTSLSIDYRETVDVDSNFVFCLMFEGKYENAYTWHDGLLFGYKIYGTGYPGVTKHQIW